MYVSGSATQVKQYQALQKIKKKESPKERKKLIKINY